MKRIITLFALFVLPVLAQDMTNSTKSVTFTNVIVGRQLSPSDTNLYLEAHGDGNTWSTIAVAQGTDGATPVTRGIALSVGQANILKAANQTPGITMDANATNLIKKYDKILLKAFSKDANRALDSMP